MFALRLSTSSRPTTTGTFRVSGRHQRPISGFFHFNTVSRVGSTRPVAKLILPQQTFRRFSLSDLKKENDPSHNSKERDEFKIDDETTKEDNEQTFKSGGDMGKRDAVYATNAFIAVGLFKAALCAALAAVVGWLLYEGLLKNSDSFVYWYAIPIIQLLPPETAHVAAIKALALISPESRDFTDPYNLRTELWGMNFSNPIGLAAGFDKHGEAIDALFGIGFGFVECGTITPKPQEGNARPRVFRLREDRAVINRFGFNSHGSDRVKERLEQREQNKKEDPRAALNLRNPAKKFLGLNVGKNKETEDAVSDYLIGVEKFGPLADYLVVNISSPNTPNLRALQKRESLKALLQEVIQKRNVVCPLPVKNNSEEKRKFVPLLVKIAPDLTEEEIRDIAEVCKEVKVDGIIVSNTTVARPPELLSSHKNETGGLSGKPLFEKSNSVLREVYRLTEGKIPIIGVGGISSGKDALEKIKSGASLVQLYTAFSYEGPGLITHIKRELSELLQREGFHNVGQAVGINVPLPKK